MKDVQLARRETDRRFRDWYRLDADEQRRADETAGDVLQLLMNQLGMSMVGRSAYSISNHALHAIALAWGAEEDAVSRQSAMCFTLGKAGLNDVDCDAYGMVPDLTSTAGQAKSPACVALAGYVAHCLDRAALAQAEKADRQQAAWEPAPAHNEDRNAPPYAERFDH